jgi:hypothetical protein
MCVVHSAKRGVARRGEERVVMSIVLSLLNLEGGLHSAAVKVLCAHEG